MTGVEGAGTIVDDSGGVDLRAAAVGEALRFVRMAGVFYCASELTEPWGLELPPLPDCVWFHVVIEGCCTVEVGGERIGLEAGDLVLLPHGIGHRGWGAIEAPTPNVFDLPHDHVDERFALLRHGDHGARSRIVCGGIRFDHPAFGHLARSLPPLIPVRHDARDVPGWLPSTLELLGEEVRATRPGSEAVISRLCDLIVIQALRHWIETDPAANTGWLGALADPHIGAALARIHADPAADWTVASLAREASMSRSGFAARFSELVGESAMRYVARWRMLRAADLLAAGKVTVAEAGASVGYRSEAAFSRAFFRVMGRNPGELRQAAGSQTPGSQTPGSRVA